MLYESLNSMWGCFFKAGLTWPRCPAVKKRMMNTVWMMERTVVHNRRTRIRECWVGCGIVSQTTELRSSRAWGRQMLRADDCTGPGFPLLCTKAVCVFASWAQCVQLVRTSWCLPVCCCDLSTYRTKRNPDGTFPFMKANTAGQDCILGLALSSYSTQQTQKGGTNSQPGEKSQELWLYDQCLVEGGGVCIILGFFFLVFFFCLFPFISSYLTL